MIWFEDNTISAELVQMRALQPEQWVKPLAIKSDANRSSMPDMMDMSGVGFRNPFAY
jgi:hypothetical protein